MELCWEVTDKGMIFSYATARSYTKEQWLEIMPLTASKSKAIKQYATEIIGSNDEDGAARWLEENVKL